MMPDKEQSPSVTEAMIEAGAAMAHERTCYAVTRADLLWIYAAMSAAYPTPDLGKDEELEKALFYKRQWHQESARAERLDNENRAQADRIEALRAEREKLRERMRLIEFDATNKNSAPSARLQRIADYARAALSGEDSPDAP
jgi:hypothetical protein